MVVAQPAADCIGVGVCAAAAAATASVKVARQSQLIRRAAPDCECAQINTAPLARQRSHLIGALDCVGASAQVALASSLVRPSVCLRARLVAPVRLPVCACVRARACGARLRLGGRRAAPHQSSMQNATSSHYARRQINPTCVGYNRSTRRRGGRVTSDDNDDADDKPKSTHAFGTFGHSLSSSSGWLCVSRGRNLYAQQTTNLCVCAGCILVARRVVSLVRSLAGSIIITIIGRSAVARVGFPPPPPPPPPARPVDAPTQSARTLEHNRNHLSAESRTRQAHALRLAHRLVTVQAHCESRTAGRGRAQKLRIIGQISQRCPRAQLHHCATCARNR